VTEIPEHLLKRSRERRQAIGGGEPSGEGTATPAAAESSASTTPATTPAPAARPAAPPTPAAPPPPKPDPPYIVADKRRTRVPFWVMPVLGVLPLWVFMYAKAMQPPVHEVTGPLASGATTFTSKCSSCHGADGQGGVGYQLNSGEVLKTFPKIQDHLSFVYTGNTPHIGQGYGDPNRPGGQHVGGKLGAAGAMPAWGTGAGGELSDVELLGVVCHERITLSGEDPTSDEAVSWCTETGENYQKVVEGGFAAAGVQPIPGG
jgi:hypothetical protein